MKRLKQRAKEDRRNLTQQVIYLVERVLQDELLSPVAKDEIAEMYKARTRGR